MQIVDSLLGNESGHKLECFPEASVCSASVGYNSQEGLRLYHVCSVLCYHSKKTSVLVLHTAALPDLA